MKSYSNDLRRKIVAAYETGDYSQDEIAELFGICQKTVSNFVRRKNETRLPDQLPRSGGRQPQLDDLAREFIRHLVNDSNHVTLAQLSQRVEQKFKKRVSLSTLCRVLESIGLPRKKRRSTLASATRRESNRREPITS